jgi:putative tryptophan/tyrosine transport system substrate-binding protein
VKRRQFITLLGGTAAASCVSWPSAVRAEQRERMRHIGVLMSQSADDRVAQTRYAAFLQGLQRSGWEVGRNVRIEARWVPTGGDNTRKSAAELVALAPDVILATGSAGTGPLLQATRSIPIVFVHTPDPVGAGYVKSMSRPGGNATGFINFEYGLGAKWLELLKQVMPHVTRAAIVRDPTITAGIGMWGAIQAAAPALGIDVIPVNIHEAREVERALGDFARSSNGGLVVTGSGLAVTHRELIVSLAARHRLPAVYFERFFVDAGGLVSYGPDLVEQYRQAAVYVDRILKGEKPGDLPVQAPTRYELVLNLKTAKELGLSVSDTLLARADEVIE